jgi:hypothetical protein
MILVVSAFCDEKLHPEVATLRPSFFHKPNAPWRCVIPAQRRWPLLVFEWSGRADSEEIANIAGIAKNRRN